MSLPSSLPFSVYSARPSDLEAGYAGFLEATFATETEALSFASEWNRIYSDGEIEFYLA